MTGAVESGTAFRSLQIVLIAHSCALLAQSALAGEFLTGADNIVKFHEWTAFAILGVCLIQTALASRVSLLLLLSSVFVLLLEFMLVATGFVRLVDVHVPLGVVAFGIVLVQTFWVMRR